jgi:hypothetical protein
MLLAWNWLGSATAHAMVMTVTTNSDPFGTSSGFRCLGEAVQAANTRMPCGDSPAGSSACNVGAPEGAVALTLDRMFADSFESDSP